MVDRGMAGDVRRIMRQCAEGEGVLVGIAALRQQFTNEVSGPNVMRQVAEFDAAEWMVAEVLYTAPAIGVGMSFFELLFGEPRIALEDERTDLVRPQQVNDLLVGQHGIACHSAATHQNYQHQRQRVKRERPALIYDRVSHGKSGVHRGFWLYSVIAHTLPHSGLRICSGASSFSVT